jgi:hypothetical protein
MANGDWTRRSIARDRDAALNDPNSYLRGAPTQQEWDDAPPSPWDHDQGNEDAALEIGHGS